MASRRCGSRSMMLPNRLRTCLPSPWATTTTTAICARNQRCCEQPGLHSSSSRCSVVAIIGSSGHTRRLRVFSTGSSSSHSPSGTKHDAFAAHHGSSSLPSSSSPYNPSVLRGMAIQANSPYFKVSRVSYTGTIETVNLDTSALLKTASIYARDLFFTLNLTSSQERRQRGSHTLRRTVSAIQSRKKKTILLSFGKVRAVASLNDVLLFDAHDPAVREFANELRVVFQSGELHGEPNELVFLECVLRDTVDSFHRRLRLFEPIGTSTAVTATFRACA